MSENLNTTNPEDSREEVPEVAEHSPEPRTPEAEQQIDQKLQAETADTEAIRQDLEELKQPDAEDLKQAFRVEDEAEPLPPPNKAVKEHSLNLSLTIARSKLSKPQKAFSEFVHRPMINSLSEVTGKTLIRPSAILSGGIFTVIGSGYYLYATEKTGYKYNFLVALLLFAGGFIVGLVLEMFYRLLSRRSTH